MTYREITYEKSGHIATLILCAPDRDNAFSPTMADDVYLAVAETQADPDVRVLVVTGQGASFCAGGDPARSGSEDADACGPGPVDQIFRDLDGSGADVVATLDKPTVASVNGIAAGAGCDLAMSCDIRIASENASIGTVYADHGLAPGPSAYFMPRVIGLGKACEVIFTGSLLSAAEAGRLGLFDEVVPASELEEATRRLAGNIANGPPVAMRFTKRAIYRGLTSTADYAKEFTVFARSLGMQVTDETREGFNSFTDKRRPQF
jgi:enoyl-CoA hydratase/carnithine racemase